MQTKEHKIIQVEDGSIAQELNLVPGDVLLAVNGQTIEDVFDFHYLVSDESLTLLVRKESGEEWELEIEKEYSQDLGITFENGLMDEYRSCCNKCIFCFIDQMPPNMRETLYFKDDDSRLSFLQGNYVTLTNMSDKDIDRIIKYKLAPINISVHTTNPELRCQMLNNRFAGDALKKIQRLYEAGIEMNGQIVLCKGINDGDELERSIRELTGYLPFMESVSVVPVGMTRYRDNLYPLEPFLKEDARKVLEIIHKWQDICYEKHGTHFIHAGDEWYLLAGQDFPEEERYDGYIQLENGVGMMRLLYEEFTAALKEDQKEQENAIFSPKFRFGRKKKAKTGHHKITVATGKLAAPMLMKLAGMFTALHPETKIQVVPIENEFFGNQITVSGLITGQDLAQQLCALELGEKLLLPCNMLRSGEFVFLDDITVEELEKTLQVPVGIVKSDGQSLYQEFLCIQEREE
ncbi:putative FeS-containing Cyanobacterial-specific oxidoreductase [uncultured Roseburia sp.]|uniref:DUF512 domain-containing protein n=1 Tax=Brotonthovivens ammoniilytica TaxID=2981725 RepID=A0ABT2TPZ7_9FIRM|nr:DUF512 domain-containing protein [Brotonthovivens ammoniilytica]MCU6763682.1 DUF512 domain-containing protein [Brotonthovivens ammoniilytica]SCJ30467.1 putative FeS-containing Cyanobacterial-specific oxidoreductase [uncultured Roseburia sp.]